MAAPVKPTAPPQALRSSPDTFAARAEASIQYQFTVFPDWIEASALFVEEKSDQALASAVAAAAGSLSEAQRQLFAGAVVGIQPVSPYALQPVEIEEYDVSEFSETLLDDADAAAWRATLELGGLATVDVLNEDDLATPSATRPPSQTAAKTYVDNAITERNMVKAWVNFNGTGTVAIRDSFNVSSITDDGTGIYTVNFTSDMPHENYAVATSVTGQGGDTLTVHSGVGNAGLPTLKTVSAIKVQSTTGDAGPLDCEECNVIIVC